MKKIYEALQEGSRLLQECEIPQPILEAQVFLSHILEKDKLYFVTHREDPISSEQFSRYWECLQERIQGKPLQYIVEKQEFMSLDFYVDENVLIPRPDTEVLVEKSIELSKHFNNPRMADVCTGSGCIAISLAYYVKEASVTALDLSKEALKVAGKNAKEHKVEEKVQLLHSDLFTGLNDTDIFDIIVSNPPYIPQRDIQSLMREVKEFEPHMALDGGEDGLVFYRRISKEGYPFLSAGGFLVFEVGHDQGEAVWNILKEQGYENLFIEKDLSGISRVVGGQKL